MHEIRHRELLEMLSSDAQIVDVLPTHEYATTHIRNAIHIPVGRIIHDAATVLDRARPVIVYCRDCL